MIHTEPEIIIVGQGICGTFLSYQLLQAGKKILVYDEPQPFSASKVASGIINPVTGRRIVRTWMIEEVMPIAVEAYQAMGQLINKSIISQCNILDFHPTAQMQQAFNERLPQEKEYLRLPENEKQWRQYFNYPFGIGEINPCWLVDLHSLLNGWRNKLKAEHILVEEKYDASVISKSQHQPLIIYCDGVAGATNPYFNKLPYALNKGEVILAAIEHLPSSNIYKQGINIVPWKDNIFWIGSSFEWNFKDDQPTNSFLQKIETQLSQWLRMPFTIVDHWAGIRPANIERRPFVGIHPLHQHVGIFNGMGTKGCSLAPYFAKEFADYLVNKKPINPLADVQRFTKVLSR